MPQTIMSANPSLRHIQRRLVTFFHFIQCGVLGPTVLRKLFTALIEKLALSLRFLRSRWRILRERKVNSSSLNLTKPKVDEGRGSTISTDGQSQVSGGLKTTEPSLIFKRNRHRFCSPPSMSRPFFP